jgi:hypothetical protein
MKFKIDDIIKIYQYLFQVNEYMFNIDAYKCTDIKTKEIHWRSHHYLEQGKLVNDLTKLEKVLYGVAD